MLIAGIWAPYSCPAVGVMSVNMLASPTPTQETKESSNTVLSESQFNQPQRTNQSITAVDNDHYRWETCTIWISHKLCRAVAAPTYEYACVDIYVYAYTSIVATT